MPNSKEPHFRAADIVTWLRENTVYNPPQLLLYITGVEKQECLSREPLDRGPLSKAICEEIATEIAVRTFSAYLEQYQDEPKKGPISPRLLTKEL